MDLIQNREVKDLFHLMHNGTKIVVEVLKGGDRLMCNISIADLPLGKYDLLSAVSIKKAYNLFTSRYGNHKDKFEDVSDFLDLFLRISEKLRNKDFKQEIEVAKHTLTPEAKAFLMAPNLIDKMDNIQRHTTEDPLIDTEDDLLVFNLVIISCKTQKPITYEHTGSASSGKTFPAEHAIRGFPEDMILDPAGVTGTAMKYDYDYQDEESGFFVNNTGEKCIYFREKEDSIDAVKFFKPMMSHDKEKLVYKVTGRDTISGGSQVITYMLDGISSFILLSVKHMDDEEMSSRTMKGSPTVSKDKTHKIIKRTFESDANREIWKPPQELEVMHDAMYNLRKCHTVNIFGPILGKIFPKDEMRRARDMNRLRGLIQACTVLHQYQRCHEIIDSQPVYYSTFEDNLISLILMDRLLESTVLGIPVVTLKLYDIMKSMQTREIPLTFNNIHEHAEANGFRMTMNELKDNHIQTLENHRLIRRKTQATKTKPRSYAINKTYDDISKVPKLTPLFIAEVQKTKTSLLKKYEKVFSNMILPPVKQPINTPKVGEKLTNVIKYLFGLNYFHTTTKNNVLWKIANESLRESLYSNEHVFKQEIIDISEQKDIIKHKRQAIKNITSGKSAKQYREIITNLDEELHREHLEEERKARELFEQGVDDA